MNHHHLPAKGSAWLIEDNEIRNFPVPAFLRCDVQDAVVRGNRIGPAPRLHSANDSAQPIMLRNTESERLEDNAVPQP